MGMFKNKEDLTTAFMAIRERLLKSVSRIVPPKDIEDIVQDTYVRACQIENKQKIAYPRTFMYRTAHNLAIDYLKRADTRLNIEINDEDFEKDLLGGVSDEPYQRVASNNEFALFCQAVRNLPRQCRRSFVLKKVYGFSQKEIARRLKISESTVEKHISTGIKRCTRFMDRHAYSEMDEGIIAPDSSNNADGTLK